MHLLVPFILQNFKKTLRSNPELWGCAIFVSKMTHLSWTNFFRYKPLILLSSTYWPFSLTKFNKILNADPELWGCTIFRPKLVHLPQTNFFWKIVNIILIYLLAPFIVQNVKKILPAYSELRRTQFLGPKWPIPPNENFFRKSVNEPCYFHSWLSTCQKSKSDINLQVKYWQLKNTEISLAKGHFWL